MAIRNPRLDRLLADPVALERVLDLLQADMEEADREDAPFFAQQCAEQDEEAPTETHSNPPNDRAQALTALDVEIEHLRDEADREDAPILAHAERHWAEHEAEIKTYFRTRRS